MKKVYKAHILYTKEQSRFEVLENGYVAVDADGRVSEVADVMITEVTEAPWYVRNDPRLAAPLLADPFTHSEIGVLMRKGQDDLLQLVNDVIRQMKSDGTLRQLQQKYGLI